jgi:hypothetical protein
MKVTIDRVIRLEGEIFVDFSTDFGAAVAVWSGDLPTVGEIHDVELDVMERIVWGGSAHCALSNVYSIQIENGSIKLTGRIISIEDGTAAVDVAGSLILIEIVGFSGNTPVFVDLEIKKIALFSTGV